MKSCGCKSVGFQTRWIAVLGVSALALASTQAFAQTGAQASVSDAGGGEEASSNVIIVSARKRQETLVEVPEAITAFTAKQIENAGLSNIRDFANLAPNINITYGQGAGYPAIMVRGLAQAQGGEAPIAVVIDGVQLADPAFISQDYGDVERVEVLRGPQGSLYGRNAIGGAINIVTKQPANELSTRFRASYANGNTITTMADISGPLVKDKILFRLGGNYRTTDGLIKNVYLDEPADFGRSGYVHGRLIFNLSDRWSLDLRGDYGHDRIGNPVAEIVTRGQFDSFDPGFIQNSKPVIETREIYAFSGKVEYQGDYLNFTSITGYSHISDANIGDADFTSLPIAVQNNTRKIRAFTEEVRLSSPSGERFQWLLGGFYQDRKIDNLLLVALDDGTGEPSNVLVQNSLDLGTSKSWAAFGSASYDIVPSVELTVGGRYDSDKRTSRDPNINGSDAAHTFTAFQPKVQIAYKPNKDMNLYATYGKGFGSGGFNAFVSIGQSRLYKAQEAENYEVGFKGAVFDERVSFSLSAFRVYYTNQQFFFVSYAPPTQNIANIDRTRVDGVEAEVSANLTRRLSLSSAFGYSDATIRRYAAAPGTIGKRSPQVPEYTFNLSGQYTIPLSDKFDLRANASYRRQGALYWDAANTVRTPPKDFINARLFLDAGPLSLGVFVENLTNAQYPTLAAVDAAGPDATLRVPSPKRSYGVQAGFRF